MIPIYTGIIASSIASSMELPYYGDCENITQNGTLYIHAQNKLLAPQIGDIVYTDRNQTIPFANNYEWVNSAILSNRVQFYTDENGIITATTQCSTQWVFNGPCGNIGAYYYTKVFDTLTEGTQMYQDGELLYPAPQTGVAIDGIYYEFNSSGIIDVVGYCTDVIDTYTDCTQTTQNPSYYVRTVDNPTNPFQDGTKLYSNYIGTSEIGPGSFVYGGWQYTYSTGSGTSSIGPCGS